MSLNRLLNRRTLTVLGLNSGTSADGLDMAVVRIRRTGRSVSTKYLTGNEKRLGKALRERIVTVASSDVVRYSELLALDNALGHFFGETARREIRRLEKEGIRVDCVASHGQTVRHLPRGIKVGGKTASATLQLGMLDRIAWSTGLTLIGDFRQADIAAGNEGAPITVGAMRRLFGNARESRLIVNIGGIANYFYFPTSKRGGVKAADCGPGNVLSDLLARRLFGKPYDRDGRLAGQGAISRRLLTILLAHPFFRSRSQVSTGREMFGTEMVERVLDHAEKLKLRPNDILATIGELTAVSIGYCAHSILRQDRTLSKLYLTGGGERNRFFRERLAARVPELAIESIDTLGIPGSLVEAASYAVMGEACLRSESLSTVHSSGNVRPVPGRIVQPPA